mmetsp:Transcript_60192/g.131856  ORF Transcript_60192/g.131856 Transcript_60192/m.131856 type:complete len:171 (-) Transcript_60192:1203-1715(-)
MELEECRVSKNQAKATEKKTSQILAWNQRAQKQLVQARLFWMWCTVAQLTLHLSFPWFPPRMLVLAAMALSGEPNSLTFGPVASPAMVGSETATAPVAPGADDVAALAVAVAFAVFAVATVVAGGGAAATAATAPATTCVALAAVGSSDAGAVVVVVVVAGAAGGGLGTS